MSVERMLCKILQKLGIGFLFLGFNDLDNLNLRLVSIFIFWIFNKIGVHVYAELLNHLFKFLLVSLWIWNG